MVLSIHMKEITSITHPLIKHLVKLREDRAYRHDQGSVLIEGIKLVTEVCQNCYIKNLLVSSEDLIPAGINPSAALLVPEGIIKKVSGLISSEGIVAEIAMPKKASLIGLNHIVVFDGVSDPGNMGTLLRTALALGWEGAFLLPDSCDPFNDKAVRSGRGAQFRLPLAYGTEAELKKLASKNQWQPLVADIQGATPESLEATSKIMLVLGNEARGPSAAIRAFCHPVTIAMPGEMESLNVAIAGSILMYILKPKTLTGGF